MSRNFFAIGMLLRIALIAAAGGSWGLNAALAQNKSDPADRRPSTHAELVGESQLPSQALFTQTASRRLRIIDDPATVNPGLRRTIIEWSYFPDGTAIENPPAGGAQSVDPPMPPNDGPAQSKLFQRLVLPAPFGFGSQRAWQTIVSNAFDRWEAICGVTFNFVGAANAIDDTVNADSGERWDQNAPRWPTPTIANIGDIRIAMRAIDGPINLNGSGGVNMAFVYDPQILPAADAEDLVPDPVVANIGYAGNIILDQNERWTDPAIPNLFETVITRAVGRAIGLAPACPNPNFSTPATIQSTIFALMQNQPFNVSSGSALPSGNTLPQLFFQTPQQDDILAAQFIYGDPLEDNDSFAVAEEITYAPPPGSNVFRFAPHIIGGSPFGAPLQLSLSGRGAGAAIGTGVDASPFVNPFDRDIFRISIPQTVVTANMTVTVDPVGTPYIDGVYIPGSFPPVTGACDSAVAAVDPRVNQNLRIIIQEFDPFTNAITIVASQEISPAGQPETVTIPITSRIYFITIDSATPVDAVQLYNLTLTVTTPANTTGEDFAPVLASLGIDAFESIGATGANVTYGNIDGEQIAPHGVFTGRSITRIAWPGVQPAVTTASAHATTVAAVATGDFALGFRGLARDAEIVSASIATDVFQDGTFSVGKNSLYFALFGMADPALSHSLGITQPVSVIGSTWAAGSRTINGEDSVSQAYDAAVSMTGVTIAVAAGNDGQAELQGFQNCPIGNIGDPNAPGTNFLGSRSVIAPATAVNVISVGALGTSTGLDYDIIAGFSSRGPIDANNNLATGQVDQLGVRAGIDIVAPGTGFLIVPPDFNPPNPPPGGPPDPCTYDGPIPVTFLNLPSVAFGDNALQPANPNFKEPVQGTSVAAGLVAGAVALLQDAARLQNPPLSIHPSVMKAIILNGAEKLLGWSNTGAGPGQPQDQRDGFRLDQTGGQINMLNTTNPLDTAQGAGRLSLRRSLENYLTGYPPALPPQANFDGPTIDPPETDPTKPSVTRVRVPRPAPVASPLGLATQSLQLAPAQLPLTPTAMELDTILRRARNDASPDRWSGFPLQVGRDDADLKIGRGQIGGVVSTGPQIPFIRANVGGGPGGGNPPPGGTPGTGGAVKAGVVPVEIDPVFVDAIGWDLANIDQRAVIQTPGQPGVIVANLDYVINVPLLSLRPDPADPFLFLPPDTITITLTWNRDLILSAVNFANPNNPQIGAIQKLRFENLDLELFLSDGLGNPTGPAVRSSTSTWGSTEHIFADIPQDGVYLIRVRWAGQLYDVLNNSPFAEQPFALAWRVDFSPRLIPNRPAGMTDILATLKSFGARIGKQAGSAYALDADYNQDGRVDIGDITAIFAGWAAK